MCACYWRWVKCQNRLISRTPLISCRHVRVKNQIRLSSIKTTFLTALACCLLLAINSLAQEPPVQHWARQYGGSQPEVPFAIQPTADGGTVVAGYTASADGDADPRPSPGYRDYWDAWIVKLDGCGNVQWKRTVGGTGYDAARDVKQTPDGGYVVVGETNSTDGDVVSGYGGSKDIWVIRLGPAGTVLWQKRYGGTALDVGNSVQVAADGFWIVASTASNDGDVQGNHAAGTYTDGFVMKIGTGGAIEWAHCYGGSRNEEFFDFEIVGNNLYLAGYSNSVDGDIPPNQKNYDVWLLAVDPAGNKIFSKVYGGSQNDVAYSMSRGKDGSFTLAGYTTSTDGLVTGAKGAQDYWVLNLTLQGNLNWQKALGGTQGDFANSVITDTDGGYLVGGLSYSADGDVVDSRGNGDYWLVKLNAAGNVVWVRNYGGRLDDQLRALTYHPQSDAYYLAGDSQSFRPGTENNYWVVKLKTPKLQIKDTTVCRVADFQARIDTLKDVCGYDSAMVRYRPLAMAGPLHRLPSRDTIFEGQSITLRATSNGIVRWLPDATLSCTDCRSPVATPRQTTSYTAVQTSATGSCQLSAGFTVVVLKDALLYVPTAFTPNRDGRNDGFGPVGKVPDGYELQVFNRWGQLLFKSNSVNQRWNGTVNGTPQDPGVFIYLIRYKNVNNVTQQHKGTFVLIR